MRKKDIVTRKITIKEVAKQAGVSIATVSRVLNGMGGYTSETERLVRKTVEALGYRQNTVARSLKTQHSNLLGFILPFVSTTSLQTILYAFEREATAAGYQVLVCRSGNGPVEIAERIRTLSRFQVDGFALCAHQPSIAFDQAVASETTMPSVLISNVPTIHPTPFVRVDDFEGAYAAATYLIQKGHRRFAALVGPKYDRTAGQGRLCGYRRALTDHGLTLPEDLTYYVEFGFHEALEPARELLRQQERFTAVLAASDDMAIALLSEAYANGLHVPDDFSVVGYDNVLAAEMAIPPLTTVAQPFEELGSQAVRMLLEEITTGQKPERRILASHIVERETVKDLSAATGRTGPFEHSVPRQLNK